MSCSTVFNLFYSRARMRALIYKYTLSNNKHGFIHSLDSLTLKANSISLMISIIFLHLQSQKFLYLNASEKAVREYGMNQKWGYL